MMGRTIDIWYSATTDRARREMLRSVVRSPIPDGGSAATLKAMKQHAADLAWILSETEKLEDTRNNIVRAPLWYMDPRSRLYWYKGESPAAPVVRPYDAEGNPRAKRLSQKDLLVEYRWFRDSCMALAEFTGALMEKWAFWQPIRDRPRLPTREDQKTREGLRPRRVKTKI
jgi:hypothetical protein